MPDHYVMFWNVENLFRPGHPSGPTTAAAYDAKLKGLAKGINEQAADAVAVQEVGDPAAVDDLIGRNHSGAHTRRPTRMPMYDFGE